MPLSSRTERHRFPSAVSVNFTVVPPEPTVRPLSSNSVVEPAVPAPEVGAAGPAFRRAAETSEVAVGVPVEVPSDAPETDVCGVAVWVGEPVVFDGWPVDWVTEVEPGVDGEVVLLVSVVTEPVEAGAGATVVVGDAMAWADWRTASDGFDPPLPLGATVVVGAGATVVLVVAGAAVVGGVVVAGALVAVVP